jgi:hypothetical protein
MFALTHQRDLSLSELLPALGILRGIVESVLLQGISS